MKNKKQNNSFVISYYYLIGIIACINFVISILSILRPNFINISVKLLFDFFEISLFIFSIIMLVYVIKIKQFNQLGILPIFYLIGFILLFTFGMIRSLQNWDLTDLSYMSNKIVFIFNLMFYLIQVGLASYFLRRKYDG